MLPSDIKVGALLESQMMPATVTAPILANSTLVLHINSPQVQP